MSVYERPHEHAPPAKHDVDAEDDDWETDPEPANLISEKEQRWGAATLPSDGKEISSVHALRENVQKQHQEAVEKEFAHKKHEVGSSYGQDKLK